jgi:ribosomal protein L40E
VPTIVSPPEEIEEPEPNARLAADYEDPPPEQRPEEKKFLDTDQGIFDLEPPTSGYVCFSCGHHMAPGTEVCQECQSIQTDSDEGICPKTNKHWKKSKEEPHKAVFQCKICTQFHLPSPTW